MKLRPVVVLIAAVAAAIALTGLGWGAWSYFSPKPTLDEVPALAAAGRFAEAESRLRAYLRAYPDDARANYLIAQLILDRPGPSADDARRALGYVEKIRPDSPGKAALAELYRGKAYFFLARFDDAEASWGKALKLDPTVPEAGWGLLELYYLQGRGDEARRLALRLHETETDARDRVKLLLELARQDYKVLAPGAIVQWFEPKVIQNPNDLHATLALGRGLILDSRIEQGLALLRKAVAGHPEDPEAWHALLNGLDDGGAEGAALADVLGRIPPALAADPRFEKHRGRVAQERRDWPAAVLAYRRAVEHDPNDPRLLYRLGRALRNAGEVSEAERIERAYQIYQAASKVLPKLYEEAAADPSLGAVPNPDLYRRMADLRERMGRRGEAAAWHRLVLEASPGDPQSRAALDRLASH